MATQEAATMSISTNAMNPSMKKKHQVRHQVSLPRQCISFPLFFVSPLEVVNFPIERKKHNVGDDHRLTGAGKINK